MTVCAHVGGEASPLVSGTAFDAGLSMLPTGAWKIGRLAWCLVWWDVATNEVSGEQTAISDCRSEVSNERTAIHDADRTAANSRLQVVFYQLPYRRQLRVWVPAVIVSVQFEEGKCRNEPACPQPSSIADVWSQLSLPVLAQQACFP